MAKHEEMKPEAIQLSWTKDEIRVQGAKANIRIPRKILTRVEFEKFCPS
jgi:hypothetical protein